MGPVVALSTRKWLELQMIENQAQHECFWVKDLLFFIPLGILAKDIYLSDVMIREILYSG